MNIQEYDIMMQINQAIDAALPHSQAQFTCDHGYFNDCDDENPKDRGQRRVIIRPANTDQFIICYCQIDKYDGRLLCNRGLLHRNHDEVRAHYWFADIPLTLILGLLSPERCQTNPCPAYIVDPYRLSDINREVSQIYPSNHQE